MFGLVKKRPLTCFLTISAGLHLAVMAPVYLRRSGRSPAPPEKIEVEWREEVFDPIPPELEKPVAEEELIEEEIVSEIPVPPPEPEALALDPFPEPVPAPDETLAPPEEAPEEARTRREALDDYITRLRVAIDSSIRYPDDYLRLNREGEVEVVFLLDRRGRLISISVPAAGASVYPLFNREAVRAVRQAAARFQPFPEEFSEAEKMTFRLPVTFTLR